MSVLIVDDNKYMQTILTTILQGFGVRDIHTEADAESAYRKFRERPTDLIVCELRLKPFNGLTFVKKVRTGKDTGDSLVPILVLTAYSDVDIVKTARDAGSTEFMIKPVSPASFFRHIVSMIEHPRQFVRSEKFFGPDRRRLRKDVYNGSKSPQRTR